MPLAAFSIMPDVVETIHHFAKGVYAKEQHLPSGWKATSHRHAFDHLSILAKGRAKVTCDGVEKEYQAPACVLIKKGVTHQIEAIEDVVWFCIHATDVSDPARVDEVLIERG